MNLEIPFDFHLSWEKKIDSLTYIRQENTEWCMMLREIFSMIIS